MEKVDWARVRDILISTICIGILLWAGWSLMGQFIHVIVLLLLAMAVAFLLTPLVNLLDGYKYVPRVIATAQGAGPSRKRENGAPLAHVAAAPTRSEVPSRTIAVRSATWRRSAGDGYRYQIGNMSERAVRFDRP